MEEMTMQKFRPHIVADVTVLVTAVLSSYRGSNASAFDDLRTIQPLPTDSVRLAEERGVSFHNDKTQTTCIALKEGVIVEQGQFLTDVAMSVCRSYNWTPMARIPKQYWVVTQYASQCISMVGGTISRANCADALIWVREHECDLTADPLLQSVVTHLNVAVGRMPRLLRATTANN